MAGFRKDPVCTHPINATVPSRVTLPETFPAGKVSGLDLPGDTRPVARIRDGVEALADPETELCPGDCLLLAGTPDALEAAAKALKDA